MTADQLKAKLEKLTGTFQRLLAKRIMEQIKSFSVANLSGDPIHVRTGQLRRYWLSRRPDVLDDGLRLVLGMEAEDTQGKIGAIQETGGDIVPKNGKLLRVPLPAALTAAGVDKFAGTTLKGRDDLGFFIPKGQRGVLLLWRKTGKTDRSAKPWYLLTNKVTIRPHYWLRNAIESIDIDGTVKVVSQELPT